MNTAVEESGMVRAVPGNEVAGHPIKKLMGVYQWFEWNGRAFQLPVMCRVLCEPVPEVSEYARDAAAECAKVAGIFAGMDEKLMLGLLYEHDRIFEKQMEEMRNGC